MSEVKVLPGVRKGLQFGSQGRQIVYREAGRHGPWRVWIGGRLPDLDEPLVPEVIEGLPAEIEKDPNETEA